MLSFLLLTAVIAGVAHGKRYPITFKDGLPTEPFIQVAVEVGTPTTDRQVECMIRQIDLAQHHSTSCSATANQVHRQTSECSVRDRQLHGIDTIHEKSTILSTRLNLDHINLCTFLSLLKKSYDSIV